MKVIKWISLKEIEEDKNKYKELVLNLNENFIKNVIPFKSSDLLKPVTWENYVSKYTDESKIYLESLREEIINNNIQLTGEDHQYSNKGIPVFENNYYIFKSYRGWGQLMASIYTTEEKPLNYMNYYM